MAWHYQTYGLSLKSAIPFPCPSLDRPGRASVELAHKPAAFFAGARLAAGIPSDAHHWFDCAALPDGSLYFRWTGLYEFLLSANGRRLACRAINGAPPDVFPNYLAPQVLSFALLKRGVDPFHATTVVIDEQAVAFLGDSGYGKSSLGAAFLQAGHRLLTDDLLVLTQRRRRFMAQPGPPQVKLFPEIAKTLLGEPVNGTPMNAGTNKLVIPLPPDLVSQQAKPLKAIYILRSPASKQPPKRLTLRTLPGRRACLDLIANTFNVVIMERSRLARQFNLAAKLAAGVPVKSLSYPRELSQLPAVVAAIEADLSP